MKNLYKIKVLHAAPRDSHTSIETYLIAETDQDVYNFINKKYLFGRWGDREKDENTKYDDKLNKYIPLEEWILKNQGDLEDEEGWDDAYYGVTKYGWEKVKWIEGSPGGGVFHILKQLGIAEEI